MVLYTTDHPTDRIQNQNQSFNDSSTEYYYVRSQEEETTTNKQQQKQTNKKQQPGFIDEDLTPNSRSVFWCLGVVKHSFIHSFIDEDRSQMECSKPLSHTAACQYN